VPVFEQLLMKYPDKVKLVYKNYPLPSHKYAAKAAMAALAAGRQGKFWEFHDELYKNYNRLNDQKVQEIALQLGLDETKFNQDKRSSQLAALIRQDWEDGKQIGIRGTPTLFINGKKIKNRSIKNMEALIDEQLKAGKTTEIKPAGQ
jgi:protein-disulfide isomerase